MSSVVNALVNQNSQVYKRQQQLRACSLITDVITPNLAGKTSQTSCPVMVTRSTAIAFGYRWFELSGVAS